MESEERLRQFELHDVVQMNPSDEMEYDIGHGAYGFVVEVNYRGLRCAGKKFYRDLFNRGSTEEREHIITRCCNECLLLSSLAHPNIVQFMGITFERGNPLPLLIMEFVPFTLSTLLNKRGILPEDISYGILVDVAMGLCYLHGRNPTIIHRDLSANNILLTSEMKAKIADLGVAKILDAAPMQSKCPGTVTYMPPEALVENPEYRTEIDLFSYGVLIIHVLCGQWPHPGPAKEHGKDGKLVAHSEYRRRSRYIEIIGDKHPMIGLIQRCLSDQPAKRPNANVILRCVQDSASRFPSQFESILDAKQHISSLTNKLHGVEKQLTLLHQENTRIELNYDVLNAKLQRSKNEQSLLSKKLFDERKICSIKEKQHHLTLELIEAEYERNLQEKCSLLDQRELEIRGLKEAMQARETKETKVHSSKLELTEKTEQNEATMKSEVDGLCRQIDSLQRQVDTKTCENEILKERQEKYQARVSKMLTVSKELLENMKLELRTIKTCEISNLKAELEMKEKDISELLSHQQRAQDYLNSKDKTFLKLKFKQCEDLPMAMSDPQCAVIDDHVYVGGGIGVKKSDHTAQSQVFEYTLLRKRWVLLTHNPARYFGLTNFMGKLVSVGGILAPNYITGNVSVYDFAEKSWKADKILSMPTKRFHPTVISHGKYLAVCGGVTQGGSTTDMVEVLVGDHWCRGPRLPHRICHAKHAVVDHSCFLMGGTFSLNPLVPSNAVISIPVSFLMSDSNSQSAELEPQWEEHRKQVYDSTSHGDSHYYPAIANHGGILLMIGGWNYIMGPSANIFAYSSAADVWIKAEKLPAPLHSLAVSTQLSNGSIMITGGVGSKGSKSARTLLMSQTL